MSFSKFMDTIMGSLLVVAVICGIIGLIKICSMKKPTTPVEESICIDSLVHTNDSLKVNINHLDSIKDVKVIEVLSLDNDSTVKLFYELVSE